MMDVWMDVKEAAKWIGVSQETVRRWLRAGDLSGLMLNDRSGYRIRYAEVQRFLAEMEARQTAERKRGRPHTSTPPRTRREAET